MTVRWGTGSSPIVQSRWWPIVCVVAGVVAAAVAAGIASVLVG